MQGFLITSAAFTLFNMHDLKYSQTAQIKEQNASFYGLLSPIWAYFETVKLSWICEECRINNKHGCDKRTLSFMLGSVHLYQEPRGTLKR